MDLPAALVPLFAAWSAAVGAVVGSFLNVVIARVPAGESIVRPRSRCPSCKAPIRWYDNLPVLSWLLLRARCRACGSRISARYPAVEALGAVAAVVAFLRHGFSGAALAELAFVAALVALAFIDLDTWLLPNAITWPIIAFGLAMGLAGVTPAGSLRGAVYGAGLGFGAFALVAWLGEKALKKEALGFGDVWLLAGLGAWMGPAALLPVVLLASLQGSVVGLALIALGKGEPGPDERPPLPGPLQAGDKPPPYTQGAEGEAPGTPVSPPSEPLSPALSPPCGARETTPSSPECGVRETGSSIPAEDEWVPPKHAVPFGPFLVAGALEWLWLGGLLARAIPVLRLFR